MPGMQANNAPLYITFGLWIFNACVGPTGWFAMWNGIKEIFAGIAVLCAAVAAWIWETTAALWVSFGEYLYDQLAVAAMLRIVTTTGTWLQATGMVVSGLCVSYAVLALGYSVWTFCVYSNTVSQQVLSVHGVHVFLPLVLAWIVFGLVGFDIEDQGQDAKENDENTDQLRLNSNENNNDVDQGNGTSSKQCRVRTNNDNLVGKPDTGKEICPDNSAKTVDQGNGTSSKQCRVRTNNDNLVGKPDTGNEICQDNSAKTGNGGEVAYGDDTRENGGTPSATTNGDRKRGHAETGTENETDSDDNGDPEKRRKVARSEVPYPRQKAVQADMMQTSE